MKITLTDRDGRKLVAKQPHDHADRVVVEAGTCEKCKLSPLVYMRIEILPGDRVRFHFADGRYVTVHVKDGELRACGSTALSARNVHADVIGIKVEA